MKAVTPVTLITMRRDDQMSHSNFCFLAAAVVVVVGGGGVAVPAAAPQVMKGWLRGGEKKVKCLITVQSQLSFVPNIKKAVKLFLDRSVMGGVLLRRTVQVRDPGCSVCSKIMWETRFS